MDSQSGKDLASFGMGITGHQGFIVITKIHFNMLRSDNSQLIVSLRIFSLFCIPALLLSIFSGSSG